MSNDSDGDVVEELVVPEHLPAVAPEAETKPKPKASKRPVKATGKPKPKKATGVARKAKNAPKRPAKAAKGKSKPKARAPKASLDAFGFRAGTARSKAVAMFARKGGATLAEIKKAVGSVQLNCLVALEAEGYKIVRKKEDGSGARTITRYFLKSK